MRNVDAPEGLFKGPSHLESWIVVDDGTRVVAECAFDLLNCAAEVAHQQLRGLSESRETVCSHEYLVMRRFAAARKSCELMTHFEHVPDQAHLDGRAGKQRLIAFTYPHITAFVQQRAFGRNHKCETDPGQQPDGFRCLGERTSPADGIVALRFRTLQRDAQGQAVAVATCGDGAALPSDCGYTGVRL